MFGFVGRIEVNDMRVMVEPLLGPAEESHYAANYDLRLLKALFNHGIRTKVIPENPMGDVPFLPVEKKIKYVPSADDIDRVIAVANLDTQDYL
ncbi:hypothetical protein SBDP1_740022 [Syntrophobacter sp. SbD1]|nr:hypothetical protein SBDP1_740022 [Syntrophobacter sp. SbD1]